MSEVPRGLSRLSVAILIFATFLVSVVLSQPLAAQTSSKPNIVVIMGDDIGWFNIGAYHRGMMAGRTPNLDKIVPRSVRTYPKPGPVHVPGQLVHI